MLYLTGSSSGGPTVILDQEVLDGFLYGLRLAPGKAEEVDFVYPHEGQFAMFHGNLLHGVMPKTQDRPVGPGGAEKERRLTLLINWWLDSKPSAPCCTEVDDEAARFIGAIHKDLEVPALEPGTAPEPSEFTVMDLMQDAGIKVTEVEADIFVAGQAHGISFLYPDLEGQGHSGEPVSVRNMGHVRRLQTAYDA